MPGKRPSRALRPVLFVLGSLLTVQAVAGPSMPTAEQIEEHNSLEEPWETPHTKWARPCANGSIRVLFLAKLHADTNVFPLRPAIELMQRFDIEGDAVLVLTKQGSAYATTYAGGSGVFGAGLGEQRLDRLLEKRYDCYVLTAAVMGHLPKSSRDRILKRVRAGDAGIAMLYGVDEEDKPLLDEAEEQQIVPASLVGLSAGVYRLGRGRLVTYKPANWNIYHRKPNGVYGVGYIFGTDLSRDLRYERQGRAILWAAGHQTKGNLFVSVPTTIDRGKLEKSSATVTWNAVDDARPDELAVRIRSQSRGGQIFPVTRDPAATTRFPLAGLPAGNYVIDAIARSQRGVEAWAVAKFSVTTATRITNVRLDRDWGEAGEPVSGTIEFTRPESGTRNPKPVLRVQAIDRYGRAVSRRDLQAPDRTSIAFTLPTDALTPHYLGIEAAVVLDGTKFAYGYAPEPYTIVNRKHDQFTFTLWGRLYTSTFDDVVEDLLAASGVTTRLETSYSPWWFMSRAGMNYTPYCSSDLYRMPDASRQEPAVDANGVLANAGGCWNAEPGVSKRLTESIDAEHDYRRHGVFAYSMGDERATLGSCLHPDCWKVYQDWLRDQYGTIEALNESWSGSLTDFDEIEPIVDETDLHWLPAEARKSLHLSAANNEHRAKGLTHGSKTWTEAARNYPRYIDRRRFQYWNFARYARRFGDEARRIDPKARCGIEGVDVHLDTDIDVIVRNTGWWMPYGEHGGGTNEVIRSIAPRGYRHGNFVGRSFYWESILRGGNAVGRWRVDNFLTPQMAVKRSIRRRVESGRIISDGLGTLLNVHPRTGMLHDGIVILHSITSIQLAKIATSHNDLEPGPTYGNFRTRDHAGKNRTPEERRKRNHLTWHRAIRACGLQFMYATDGQIERGEFDPAPYKVMILSQHEAIGPDEEKAIRGFVDDGGTVIADVRPGIYGARGKARDGGVLDDMFGVRHETSAPAKKIDGSISGRIGDVELGATLPDLYVNPAVSVTHGKALGKAGDTPICIVNELGAGRAVLLNFTMWSYPNLAEHEGPEDAAELLRGLFASAGIDWPLRISGEDGRRHRNIEAMRWRTGGDLQVVALYGPSRATFPGGELIVPAPFTNFDDPVAVTVRLPRPMHVYEMRSGRYEGPVTEFTTDVKPWWATLLAVSERELKAPQLMVAGSATRRGAPLTLEARIPGARAVHALRLTATDPDGGDAPWFTRTVFVENGAASIDLPVAANEQRGNWTLEARDLYTEKIGTLSFTVE